MNILISSSSKTFEISNIPNDFQGMDAGRKTIENFYEIVIKSKTILWNGPVGVFEFSNFSKGTKELGKYNDWSAYAEGEGKNLACLAVSKPKKGYFVQLASFNNETKAKVSVDVLNEKLAVSLSGNELQIMRVDLGDGIGIWWRIVTNTMPRGEAETVCALLKSEGNNCIVRSR